MMTPNVLMVTGKGTVSQWALSLMAVEPRA
jgi:hypothetical protein